MTHRYPRTEWTPCSEPPDDPRAVIVWHRGRAFGRMFRYTVASWYMAEYQRDDPLNSHPVYQPHQWRDLEPPL